MATRAAVGFAALLLAAPVSAHECDGHTFCQWEQSQLRPDRLPRKDSCCGPADVFYPTEYHEDTAHPGGFILTVPTFASPIIVPPQKVLQEIVNPEGHGVLWMSTTWIGNDRLPDFVFCFAPGLGL